MIKGTTKSGFEFEYEETTFDDMRVVDMLAMLKDADKPIFERIAATSKLLCMILGEKQKTALYEHIGKQYGGRVPPEAAANVRAEIMNVAGTDAEKN